MVMYVSQATHILSVEGDEKYENRKATNLLKRDLENFFYTEIGWSGYDSNMSWNGGIEEKEK